MKQSFSYTLSELAEKLNAQLRGDGKHVVTGLNTLQEAGASELAFLANPAYIRYLESTRACAVILSPAQSDSWDGNALLMKNPYLGYAKVSHLFATDKGLPAGIHPSASVSEDAELHPSSAIGANVVIESGVQISEGVRVDAGTVIGHDSVIGADSHIGRNVTICHGVSMGERVIVHPGAIVGADGFGNAVEGGKWVKIEQIGGVVIGNDVEIGSCTCIDRGALGNTVIHDGVRLDNLIQIAHNVEIGENTAIAANCGISGSTRIGKNCMIAGATGFAGHLTIADNVFFSGMSMVTKSIHQSGAYASGTGLMDLGGWRKNAVRFRHLDKIAKRLSAVERKVDN